MEPNQIWNWDMLYASNVSSIRVLNLCACASDISECFICGYGDQASVLKEVIQPFASWDNCEVPETFHSTATPIGLRYYPTRAPPKS